MGLLILIVLIVALITGSLWQVLQVAAGVALGLFLFVAAIALAVYWFVRRRVKKVHQELERYRRDRFV
jgi:membrane protein implicated in regulation of membrane protease activity